MHFRISRVERGGTFPVGYLKSTSEKKARARLPYLNIMIRGQEGLIIEPIFNHEELRQATALERERQRTITDCAAVLERIEFSVE